MSTAKVFSGIALAFCVFSPALIEAATSASKSAGYSIPILEKLGG